MWCGCFERIWIHSQGPPTCLYNWCSVKALESFPFTTWVVLAYSFGIVVFCRHAYTTAFLVKHNEGYITCSQHSIASTRFQHVFMSSRSRNYIRQFITSLAEVNTKSATNARQGKKEGRQLKIIYLLFCFEKLPFLQPTKRESKSKAGDNDGKKKLYTK